MIVLLTEEQSMGECLKVVLPQLWPDSREGLDWQVLSFQGKGHLKKSIPKRIKNGEITGIRILSFFKITITVIVLQ